jgi:hypothetical protein
MGMPSPGTWRSTMGEVIAKAAEVNASTAASLVKACMLTLSDEVGFRVTKGCVEKVQNEVKFPRLK